MSVSRSKIAVLLMILAVFVSACGGAATPTRPPATSVPVEVETDEVEPTEAAAEPTEEATVEAADADETEEATVEADETEEAVADETEEATEVALEPTEMATEEETLEVAGADETEEATEVALEPTEMATEEATVEVAVEPTEMATEEATDEVVTEVTLEVTEEMTVEATMEATEDATMEATEEGEEMTAVTVQLQGESEAGYASFYAAADQGYYEDEGLDVAWEANSEEVPLMAGSNFGVADVYSVLVAIEEGEDVVVIGFLPRAAVPDMGTMTEMTQETEAEATMDADATEEADMGSEVGTDAVASGYLAIYTSSEWLSEEGSEDVAVAFLRATLMGWDYCSENSDECVDIVSAAVPDAPQTNLDVITESAGMSSADMMDTVDAQWEAIVAGALAGNVIAEEPSSDAIRVDLFIDALESLSADSTMETEATVEMEATDEMDSEATVEADADATAEATP